MKKGRKYIKKTPILLELTKRKAIVMKDYEEMYKIKELNQVWKLFFETKYLYRFLMLSRTEPIYRKVHARNMDAYEKAFFEQRFIGISRITGEEKLPRKQSNITSETN